MDNSDGKERQWEFLNSLRLTVASVGGDSELLKVCEVLKHISTMENDNLNRINIF